MNFKKLALAAAAGATLLSAAPVFAQSYYYGPAYRYQPYRYHHHRHPVVVYEPAPYYYYPPAPAYYYEPRPVVYGRVPIGHHGRVGFAIGL